jgi:hypothetical protein
VATLFIVILVAKANPFVIPEHCSSIKLYLTKQQMPNDLCSILIRPIPFNSRDVGKTYRILRICFVAQKTGTAVELVWIHVERHYMEIAGLNAVLLS